jgi:hypothetical protein
MKKRGLMLGLIFILSFFSFASVFAVGCDLQVSLFNQDPYPASPGDDAKIVFQIDGLENPNCGTVEFQLIENFPITLKPDQKSTYIFQSGTFQKDYESFFLAPFKVSISPEASEFDNQIEVRYKQGISGYESKDFEWQISDVLADFEIYVKDYDSLTQTITLEILNIAENDIEALTLEISNQENIKIKGSKIKIVGDLDSNDYTTADFEAIPTAGEFKVKISYTDSIGERRVLEKNVVYESEYFENRVTDQKETSKWTYVFWIVVILIIGYYFFRRYQKKKALRQKLNRK